MRRILILGVLVGVGVLIARALKLNLRERMMARCQGMMARCQEMMARSQEMRDESPEPRLGCHQERIDGVDEAELPISAVTVGAP